MTLVAGRGGMLSSQRKELRVIEAGGRSPRLLSVTAQTIARETAGVDVIMTPSAVLGQAKERGGSFNLGWTGKDESTAGL